MGWYAKAIRAVGRREWGSRLSVAVIVPIDRFLYVRSGGRFSVGHLGERREAALPTLLLTTTGRKSGEPRTTPVVYLEDGSRLVVVGSNFGQQRHPAWSGNLLADPRASVQIRTKRQDVVARLATEAELEELWLRLLEIYPGWTDYRTRTDRSFRAFFLEPAAA